MRCGRAQKLLTAAIDGELSPGRRTALDRHLAGCPACRAERAATQTVLEALDALPIAAAVPAALEQATLRRVRVLAADEAERTATSGWRTWLPLPAIGLVVTAALVLAIAITRTADDRMPKSGAPAPTRVARAHPAPSRANPQAVAVAPPSEPPPALAAAPELFVDLPMLRKLDRVKHFEAIQTTTLDDETPSGEEAPSNG
jgi:anti-sigma factor RsiW